MGAAGLRRRRATRILLALIIVPVALALVVVVAFRVASLLRESEPRAGAAPSTGRFVRGGDVEVFVQEAGPAHGPPVLLVHGTGAWSAIWRETMDALAARGYRAIAIDIPPFGFSERPASAQYDDASQAARIVGVLDALEVQDVTLVGHSFGARPTVEAALLDPSRVRLLVLVDAALSPTETPQPAAPPPVLVRTVVTTSWLRDPLIAATMTNPILTRTLLRQLILDPTDATDAQVRMVHAPFRISGSTPTLGQWVEQFLMGGAPARNRDASR
jgi:pimeloyl-ACP methyl ester carboxylesterase